MLGKIGDEKAAWGRLHGHPDRQAVPGVVVARLDAPLFWANATAIEDRLVAEVERSPDTRALVLDLEATTQLDTTAADVLTHLAHELGRRGVGLYLARVLHRVEAVLERSGFYEQLGPEHTWHSISQCVRAARRHTGLKGDRKRDGSTAGDRAADDLATDAAPDRGVEPSAEVLPPPEPPDDGDRVGTEAEVTGEREQAADSGIEEVEIEVEVIDDEVDVVEGGGDSADAALWTQLEPIGASNLENAVDFYLCSIRDGRPEQAIAAYTADGYTEHRRGVQRGASGFVDAVKHLVERYAIRYVRVVRTIEDGPFVFLHAFRSLNSGESESVTADFFEMDADHRIVEHWEVSAAYRAPADARHTPIDGPTTITDLELTGENKATVRTLIEQVLMRGGQPDRLGEFVADDCIEHGEALGGGLVKKRKKRKKAPAAVRWAIGYDEIVLLVGQGSFVATLCRVQREGVPSTQVDIFRVQYGRIVEHWENAEPMDVGDHGATGPT